MDIRDIARRAKVSTATVSRTINRVPTVDPELAKRVWKAIDELGYYPNTQARALVSGRSRIFGLVVSDVTNPFFPGIVQSFEETAVQHNYEILLTSTTYDPARMEHAVRRMIERRVDGVAVMTFGMEELLLTNLHNRKVALAFIDVGPPVPLVSNIRVLYQLGIREAVKHLRDLGHSRIAFVAGPDRLRSALARSDAFLQTMADAGLPCPPPYIPCGDHTIEGGMAALDHLLALPEPPTAVMCSNDMSAIGVMRKAYERGLSIPRDLSVIGFDDIRLSEFIIPPLTTVQMSQYDLGRLAFQALLMDVERETPSPSGSEYVLETKLILRKSTGPAPSV